MVWVDAGGVDAGGVDAGGVDAGGVDAGGVDAGGVDAGGVDAGPVGVDAGSFEFWTVGSSPLLNPRAVEFDGAVHLFAYDPVSHHLMWCDGAPACQWQTLDGAGGGNGRVTSDVGAECIATAVWGGDLHVFYRQAGAMGPEVLRTARRSAGAWTFASIDGVGGGMHGVTSNRVGGCPSAAAFASWLFVSFYDYDARMLRVGWTNALGWDFFPMDGAGGFNGRTTGDVGYWSALVSTGTDLRVFYSDATHGGLREGKWTGAGDWSFQVRDPSTAPIVSPVAAVTHASSLHVFYADSVNGDLKHTWFSGSWASETIDGDGLAGRTTHEVGAAGISALSTPTTLHVFYTDTTAGDLRQARLTAFTWARETIDGDLNAGGRIDGDVGRNPTAVVASDGGVVVFFEGPNTLRQVLIR